MISSTQTSKTFQAQAIAMPPSNQQVFPFRKATESLKTCVLNSFNHKQIAKPFNLIQFKQLSTALTTAQKCRTYTTALTPFMASFLFLFEKTKKKIQEGNNNVPPFQSTIDGFGAGFVSAGVNSLVAYPFLNNAKNHQKTSSLFLETIKQIKNQGLVPAYRGYYARYPAILFAGAGLGMAIETCKYLVSSHLKPSSPSSQ